LHKCFAYNYNKLIIVTHNYLYYLCDIKLNLKNVILVLVTILASIGVFNYFGNMRVTNRTLNDIGLKVLQ